MQKVKSPTRVDIAGGFLDIWPVYALIKDCVVVNYSIPIFTSSEIISTASPPHSDNKKNKVTVEVNFSSNSYKKSFNSIDDFVKDKHSCLDLLKVLWKHGDWKGWDGNSNITIKLNSESPIGAGLGGSSSLLVSLVKSFAKFWKQNISPQQIPLLCRDLETYVLHAPAGTQDYIPALHPKPNQLYIISYNIANLKESLSSVSKKDPMAKNVQFAHSFVPSWVTKPIPEQFLKDHIMIVHTGISHHSGQNNWQILKQVIEKNKTLLQGLKKLRDNAEHAVRMCETEDWTAWGEVLRREYQLRQSVFPGWQTPTVAKICNTLIETVPGTAVKLCGAGGGGSAIVFAKNKKQKQALQQLCEKHKISTLIH